MRKRKVRLLPVRVVDRHTIEALPQRTSKQLQNFNPFERFQIGLPPGKFGIILRANWHRPGGCRPIPKSELPP
jgi:hypothetical protein